ncbi:MAG: PIG-L deacetylase family protein [Saprospiraceae bacterium]
MLNPKRILVLAPHTDDGELGCGATIAKFLEAGAEVFYVAFSTAEESVPAGFPKNQLEVELKAATQVLGIKPENVIVFKYEVRKLNYVRQEILEKLIELKPKIKPDFVFLPSTKDIHQDHTTIANEGIRAFKACTILGYELIWNNLSFNTDCFIEVTPSQLQKKIDALQAYKTQEGRAYMDPKFIESLAMVRGTQIGKQFAETFEVIRWIIS